MTNRQRTQNLMDRGYSSQQQGRLWQYRVLGDPIAVGPFRSLPQCLANAEHRVRKSHAALPLRNI